MIPQLSEHPQQSSRNAKRKWHKKPSRGSHGRQAEKGALEDWRCWQLPEKRCHRELLPGGFKAHSFAGGAGWAVVKGVAFLIGIVRSSGGSNGTAPFLLEESGGRAVKQWQSQHVFPHIAGGEGKTWRSDFTFCSGAVAASTMTPSYHLHSIICGCPSWEEQKQTSVPPSSSCFCCCRLG